MKIKHELAKTNMELLEHSSQFMFPGYIFFDPVLNFDRKLDIYLSKVSTKSGGKWRIHSSLGTYDKNLMEFSHYLTYNYNETALFDSVYEAYKVVKELIK